MLLPACKGYCDHKDGDGKQEKVSDVNLSEPTIPSGWENPHVTNICSNRRVHRQQQRQPALFAQLLTAHLILDAEPLRAASTSEEEVLSQFGFLVDGWLQGPR